MPRLSYFSYFWGFVDVFVTIFGAIHWLNQHSPLIKSARLICKVMIGTVQRMV